MVDNSGLILFKIEQENGCALVRTFGAGIRMQMGWTLQFCQD